MSNSPEFDELRDRVLEAYEESSTEPVNDYDMAEINRLVRQELEK